ncbi:MAG: hypothetical protein COB07_01225 [Sulfurovum sp.]|nr:MAG: hypothetical protein COB07_01225 [Sulfurovum sp.]
MTILVKIEEEIRNFPAQELSKFREWFKQYDVKKWDEQIENDFTSGKLDDLANQALKDFQDDNVKTL